MSRQGKLAALASTGVTKAELDLLDGVTSTTAELNITDGVTSTAAELSILAGVTATAAEINLIDGGTARGTTAIVDADGVLVNDAGTMRMTTVATLATYIGTKITGGSMVYIASSGAISNAATVSFTQFDASKYDHYKFWLQDVRPQTDTEYLYAHVSTDAGSNYDTTNGNYHVSYDTDAPGLPVSRSGGVGSGASTEYGVTGEWSLLSPHKTSYTKAISLAVHDRDGGIQGGGSSALNMGVHLASQDTDAVQFKFSSGNITSGEIVMYGIANGT